MAMPDAAGALVSPAEFRSLNALRAAHTELLRELGRHDDDSLPEPFIAQIREFLQRGEATGVLLDVDEDRTDAQTLLNYWTTVLYGAGVVARPTLLADFDPAASRQIVGDISPYVGLRAFVQKEGPVFFGRRPLVQRITAWLESHRFAALVGLSGSGKSSLVRAGVVPALREGAVTGSPDWRYLEPMVPGADPVRSLAEVTLPSGTSVEEWQAIVGVDDDRFVRALGTVPVVLIVDQLEELFTISRPKAACDAFVLQLSKLVKVREPRHTVIVTLRSDFEAALLRYPGLAELFSGDAVVRVPPLDPAGLRNAIERPAARQGVSFEDGLVGELVQQVLGEPAGLPLLQFTLLKLWEAREGKTITWNAYRSLGGNVREILASSASRTYESFKLEEDRRTVEQVLKKLIAPGVGGEVTSKRLPRAELYPEDTARDRVERVLDILVTEGLLRVTPGSDREADQIEITHEALLRNWPLLTDWIAEDRDRQRKRLQFAAAAEWWLFNGEHPSGLLTGLRLAEAEQYENLKPEEQRFVSASRSAAESSRRNMWLLATLAFIAALALLAWAAYKTLEVSDAMYDLDRRTKALKIANDAAAKADAERQRTANDLRQRTNDLRQRTTELTVATDAAAKAAAEKVRIERETMVARQQFADLLQQRRELEVQRDQISRERDELSRHRDEAALQSQAARSELAELRQQIQTIQTQLSQARQEATAAQEQASVAQQEARKTAAELRDVEQQLEQRPMVRLEDGKFRAPKGPWQVLEQHASGIEQNARGVAQLRIVAASGQPFYMTGFLVAPDVIATLWLDSFGSPRTAQINAEFAAQSAGDEPKSLKVLQLIGHDRKTDVALFRIEAPPGTFSRPLQLDFTPPKVAARVYIIGYPIGAGREKRIQPGYVVSVGPDGSFTHDGLTAAGNSGSPVIDLATGKVIGVHWGAVGPRSGPDLKRATSLAAVAKSSLFRALTSGK